MVTKKRSMLLVVLMAMAVVAVSSWSRPAEAGLVSLATYTGAVAVSTDGFGNVSADGIISASVPTGSTVLGAYLYTATNGGASPGPVTLAGVPVTFPTVFTNAPPCCPDFFHTGRADVTSIVAPLIGGGGALPFDFAISDGSSTTVDGEALVVVYSNPLLPTSTVAIMNGGQALTGDTFTITFASPLAPGFFGEMRLGDSFSCCGQESTVKVNGTTISTHAGNNDDGTGPLSNGQLITVGGFDDPFSPFLPSYADDHERYDLSPYMSVGDTTLTVFTVNPSLDDNIFLAVFHLSGEATVTTNPVPEPASILLFGSGLAGLAAWRRKKAA
nr:PEP-CTERM sorting domain-containing protein [Nitrospirota bacterium]